MQLQNGRPTDTTGRLDKEIRTYDFLDKLGPKQEFIKKENHFLFKMDKEQNADLYYCPMLDRKSVV